MPESQLRLQHPNQPLTDAWRRLPVEPRGSTLLGISFRPRQAEAFGLPSRPSLQTLLAYSFQLIRLAAYWDRIESRPGSFETDELDWQIDAAEAAGKRIILCVGPVKAFGYPEYFVPEHVLPTPLPEHTRITPATHPALLEAGEGFISRLVERYSRREAIVAWQLEHEAVDPLGVEHSWRLDAAWVQRELEALRLADPVRPVLLNGFLPTSWLVRVSQWWRTRDQGDSLAVAERLADMVGIDYYPRNALLRVGRGTLYLDRGTSGLEQDRRAARLLAQAKTNGRRLLITEGQAEPWETSTTPPSPSGQAMFSCLPEHIISNYNACMSIPALYAYLFWGGEYWLLRQQGGDDSYLRAFARVLELS
jgi:Beta-galactosidase